MSMKFLIIQKKIKLLSLIIMFTSFMSGCSTISYYSQAVVGHFKLLSARQNIDAALASAETDDALKLKLTQAQKIRKFASERLGLPENNSYKSFAITGKNYITWNVIAASEFSVQAKTWCFPVAGCVSYKGYFAEESANQLAEKLSDEGFDTTVTGATAYSTIGWFDDPILDTMLKGEDTRIAGLIFHELAHQQLYVKDDSDFNEAFASFVEQQGVRIWLKERNDVEGLDRYRQMLEMRADFSELLLATRNRLQKIYASERSEQEKRQEKVREFEHLRRDYKAFKYSWNDYSGYDAWFSSELNNAKLVATATYRRLIPAFTALYDTSDNNIDIFYRKVREIAKKNKHERENNLTFLLENTL